MDYFIKAHFENENEEIVSLGLEYLERIFGEGWDTPEVTHVRRWKYSHPEGIASFDSVNRPGTSLLIASDGLLGGQTEQAFECGVKVAKLLISTKG